MTEKKHPEQDPAEGSRKTIERELRRQGGDEGEPQQRARRIVQKQVKDEAELPQKRSA